MLTVSSAMKDNSRRAFKQAALFLLLLAYAAALGYAAVRSYGLFAATVEPDMLPLALVGIVALELLAVALPLGLHYAFAPGIQRMAATTFYVFDLALIGANAVLDAAHHSGTVLPAFLTAYGTFAVPALPVFALVVCAVLWATDAGSRERDMTEAVRAATHEALMAQIQKAAESVDITASVEQAAHEAARALVGETLGRVPRRAGVLPGPAHAAADGDAALALVTMGANGTARKARAEAGPK